MDPLAPPAARRRAGRRGSLRGENLALALQCIAEGSGTVSRADISALTALNKSTTGSLVDELVAGGLVRELGVTARATVGRPPTALALVTEGPAGLGIEVNVDYLAACVVDLTGAVRYEHVLSQDQRGQSPAEVLGRAARLGRAAVQAAAERGLVPYGTAVAVPGLVDSALGRVVLAPNLGWADLDPLARLCPGELGTAHDATVTIDNEANCAALSERDLLTDGASYLYIYGEIGVGAGIVLGGRLFRGHNGWSGEIGHLTVERDGPVCGCGGRGCLEQFAGQEAILRAAGIPSEAGTSLGAGPTRALIRERAEAGDPAMLAALERAGRALGLVVACVLNLLDLDRVVLGGIYRELSEIVLPFMREEVMRRYAGARWASPVMEAATYAAEAPSLGAARSVVRRIIDDPQAWLSSQYAAGSTVRALPDRTGAAVRPAARRVPRAAGGAR